MPKIALPVEKLAGRRKVVRRRPHKITEKTNPFDYYKENKTSSIFSKKLANYRFLIYTDLETDDMAFLAMFTAWIKVNESFFDSRSNFPIYGFIVGESQNKNVKAQRAREFLQLFADIMQWSDIEHHLYTGYNSAGKRVWFDGEGDKTFDNEEDLLENPNVINDPDYPEPELFIDTVEELMKVKPDNIFIFYLKPIRLFQNKDNQKILDYLQRVPGAIYGSWNVRTVLQENPEITTKVLDFLNRSTKDAPLLYIESLLAIGNDNTINIDNAPKLFRTLDDAEDESLAMLIKKTMYKWNDNLSHLLRGIIVDNPAFSETDFDDYESFLTTCAKLSAEESNTHAIKSLNSILKYQSQQFVLDDPLVMIAVLIGNGTLKGAPFRLQRSEIGYTETMTVKTKDSNTFVLLPKGELDVKHLKDSKKLLENMLILALDITN
jgi:hypothetical protein